ncbi:MAG: class I tRNA ligase family protein [Patescibacteria group bacterium]
MSKKYYITTPIYYVNDVPHVGHAYTTIAADVLARYHREKGEEVFFLTGTDEHGAKIAEAAEKAGKEPKAFVDELAPKFQEVWKKLNINYSEFFRTTNPEHERLVQEFIGRVNKAGYIEKRQYTGLYCIACERYYREDELIDGKCPDHKRELVRQSEENYFFLLSKFGDQLLEKIESGEMEIGPETRKNEIVSKIKLGLEDISISRANVKWGIPFPGDESQTIYVWFDALLNYWTATKIYGQDKGDSPQAAKGTVPGPEWPADLHLMAKDILWFHAVIWPAMLLAAGEAVPKKVFAHGFFTINGQKMSKTLGNVINPNEVVDKFGADAVRYALLREFPFGEDGDISVEKIGERHKELADTLGNLLQRTVVMINKYQVHTTSSPSYPRRGNGEIDPTHSSLPKIGSLSSDSSPKIGEARWGMSINLDIESSQFSRALEKIMTFAAKQNQFINEKAPWVLAKEGKTNEIKEVLSAVYGNLMIISELFIPFMPETAKKMKQQLESLKPEPLFPRIDLDKTQMMKAD